MSHPLVARLPALGTLRATGADASRFLQGQLSQDIERVEPGQTVIAGLHTPQGRVIAVLRLRADDDGILLILPRELAAPVAAHLSRYVLRAKVRIEDVSALYVVYGIADAGGRTLLALPGDAPPPAGSPIDAARWHQDDIALGLPQVYPATSGRFVAQMLNLDRIDGVSFTKGCYTGQEIIARAHYLGRVKRRMQRFIAIDAPELRPGDPVTLANGDEAEVVNVARREDGAVEFLAVAPLAPQSGPATADTAPQGGAKPLPLPYALED